MNTKTDTLPRPEFPRPDRQRQDWLSLNGTWSFRFDPQEVGEADGWHQKDEWTESRGITVPFAWQSRASGIADTGRQECAWYQRPFSLPREWLGRRVFLHFGAVDHEATVWVDGKLLGSHRGGYTPFSFLLQGLAPSEDHILTVRVLDRFEASQIRGKQAWMAPDRCWYTASSGIWQSVWLEAVGDASIGPFSWISDIDHRVVEGSFEIDGPLEGLELQVEVSWRNEPVLSSRTSVDRRNTRINLVVPERDFVDETDHWTPETPNLFDVVLRLARAGTVQDEIRTYFAMRKFEIRDGEVWLNNRLYRQRLVLDQGYWPDTLLTPPTDQALVDDILWTKRLGFNGARKHQKIEDPRYYYWADRLGLLVWGELPSSYEFVPQAVIDAQSQWAEFLRRDLNHPCIVTWVPYNESWGLRNIRTDPRQQAAARALVQFAKALDSSRPVSGNDGWEWVESDLVGVHDYCFNAEELSEKLERFDATLVGAYNGTRATLALGAVVTGQPLLVTEFGGVAYSADDGGWGYHGVVKTPEAFFRRLTEALSVLSVHPRVKGWCYTQLTDTFQEVNGLLTMDRVPKVAAEVLAELFLKA